MTSLWLADRAPVETDALDREAYDVVVVGAGLTGLTAGLMLARTGRSVAVLEAREVGAVTTGNTTAKLSLLQGTKLSTLRSRQSKKVTQAYVDGNLEGQRWLLDFCESAGVAVQRRDAITYAAKRGRQRRAASKEYDAARELGLPVRWDDDPALPVPNAGGVVLADQAQFDPVDVLAALAAALRKAGGVLVTDARVTGMGGSGSPRLQLAGGRSVGADQVVLATGTPILDRGLYFAKLEPMRSYCIAVDHATTPEVMALSTASSSRSLRDAPGGSFGRRLIVGGAGHPVGRTGSERAHLDELRSWTQRYFPGAVETHTWSAQDYATHDGIPYVGPMPFGRGNVYVATGYAKWGMTNAVMAALDLTEQIVGGTPPAWAKPMHRRITGPRNAASLVRMNAAVGVAGAVGAVGAALSRKAEAAPAEGEGRVARDGVVPVGTSTVDGRTCRVTAVCPHLGGVLEWNDAERSWDCPLHGSRFTPTGAVLEGPATTPLPRRS